MVGTSNLGSWNGHWYNVGLPNAINPQFLCRKTQQPDVQIARCHLHHPKKRLLASWHLNVCNIHICMCEWASSYVYIYMFICTFVVLYYMCVFVGWITVCFTCRISSFRYGWFYRKTWLHLWSTHWFILTIPIKLATWGYYTFFSDTPQIKYVYICLYRLFPALYPQ